MKMKKSLSASKSNINTNNDDDSDVSKCFYLILHCFSIKSFVVIFQETTSSIGSPKSVGGKQKSSSKSKKNLPTYQYVSHIREDHGVSVFGVAFNDRIMNRNVFATVGINRVTIYEAPTVYSKEKGSKQYPIKLLKCYADPDSDEIFYACSWSYNSLKQQLIAAAGLRGVIRIINIDTIESEINLIGHSEWLFHIFSIYH